MYTKINTSGTIRTYSERRADMDSVTTGEGLVRHILLALVENPDNLVVRGKVDQLGILIEVNAHPEDLGRIIGKKGSTVEAIRTIMRVLGTTVGAHYNVKVLEDA